MLDQPMYTKIVERIHDTKPQKQLSPGERKNNLKKAFRGNLKEYQKAGTPKRILVIDDIYTTGSTAEAVTTALKQLGVQEVYVFCIAIGKGFPDISVMVFCVLVCYNLWRNPTRLRMG